MKLNRVKTWGVVFFLTGNLIKPLFTFKPQDLMGDNGLQLHYFVVTQKICIPKVIIPTH